MGGWCDMLDLFLYFWLSSCFCHRWREDPGLDWILFCFGVAILLSMLFLSVMKNKDIWSLLSAAQGRVIPFYACKAVSLFLFQHIRKGKPFLTHPLLPQLLLWVGEANHSSLWKKSSGNSLNWNCFLSLATNHSCTAKSHAHHYRDLVFHEGKRVFSNAASERPLDVSLTVLVMFIKMVTIKRIRILKSSFSPIFNPRLTSNNLLCDVIVLLQQPAVTLHSMWILGFSQGTLKQEDLCHLGIESRRINPFFLRKFLVQHQGKNSVVVQIKYPQGIYMFFCKDILSSDTKSCFRDVQQGKAEGPKAWRVSELLFFCRIIQFFAQACTVSEILDIAPLFPSLLLGAQ